MSRVLARCERRHALARESEDVLGTPHAFLSLAGIEYGTGNPASRVLTSLSPQRLDTLDPAGSTVLTCASCRRTYRIDHGALLAVAADRHARSLTLESATGN